MFSSSFNVLDKISQIFPGPAILNGDGASKDMLVLGTYYHSVECLNFYSINRHIGVKSFTLFFKDNDERKMSHHCLIGLNELLQSLISITNATDMIMTTDDIQKVTAIDLQAIKYLLTVITYKNELLCR